MRIRIVTDSAADLEPEEFSDRNIQLIPLSITVDQRIYQADLRFNRQAFFQMLAASSAFPTTSQPAPGDFEEIFEEARAQGDQLIYISISSALSGTFQCASVVKAMGNYDNVFLVDSLSATLGQKLLVLHAADLRDRGCPAEEIVEELTALRSRIRIFAGLETLEYLQKGGRLSRTAAGLGTLTRIKPVVTTTEQGTVAVAGKCMGKVRAMSQIAAMLDVQPPDPEFPIYGVYSYDRTNLTELLDRIAQKGGPVIPETDCFCLGPVIGAHIGPGGYGIAYIAAEQQTQ